MKISLKFVPKFDVKPLYEPMIAQFTDAYMRYSDSMS